MSLRLAHRPRRTAAAPPGDDRRERGAIIVEFAIVAMLLVTIVAGTYDYGMGWRASLASIEGARAGARTGSAVGPVADADRQIITGMKSTFASSGLLANVERVVLFSATTANGAVPSACITGSATGCNVFTGDQFRAVTSASAIDANGCIVTATKGFCPLARNNVQLTANYIGVWVRVRYDFMFRILKNNLTIDRTAVMRLEPEVLN